MKIQRSSLRKVAMAAAFAGTALLGAESIFNEAQASGSTCKVEVLDCPGLGTGDRQICVTTGTGLTCSCGAATECL